MEVIKKVALKAYNSFGISALAENMVVCSSTYDVTSLCHALRNEKVYILGGGNNILFDGDFAGYIIKPEIKGIEITAEDDETVTLHVGAGEDWDAFVEYTVKNDWGGLENLSLIPGTVGASPVQNIGAYGAEVGNVIVSVEGVRLSTGQTFVVSREECRFGYRDSIFKNEMKGDAIITYVNFRLTKKPVANISYAPVREAMSRRNTETIQAVREEIINIRNSKLPDPKVQGNAGSFFKNPEVPAEVFERLRAEYPGIPSFPLANGDVKIPAAWLIDQCGWKGKALGKAAVHHIQPLVLVNNGGATAGDILALAGKIISDVKEKFGVELAMEVNLVR